MNKTHDQVTHLLFDLDGTLVHMNEWVVELGFLLRAIPRFKSAIAPHRFRKAFWGAAAKMKQHSGEQTNFEVYIDELSRYASVSKAELTQLAHLSVSEDFEKLGRHIHPVPGAIDTLRLAHTLGYRLVIATNPTFPLSGVLARMKYGGLLQYPYEYITHSEIMKHTKPDPRYYGDLLDRLDVTADRCLMIGNDPTKDLGAKEVGISTFILDIPTNDKLNIKQLQDKRIDYCGNYGFLQQLLLTQSGERAEK